MRRECARRRGWCRRRRARCRPRSSARWCRRRRRRPSPRRRRCAPSAPRRCRPARRGAACARSRRRTRAAPRRRRRRARPRAASRCRRVRCASVVLPVLSAPSRATTKAAPLMRGAGGAGAGASRRQARQPTTDIADEDGVEQHRQPQPLVGEEGRADDVDDDPDRPVLDVLAAEQPLAEDARGGRERVPPGHVGVGEAAQEEGRRPARRSASARARRAGRARRASARRSAWPEASVPRSHCHQPQPATAAKKICRLASP